MKIKHHNVPPEIDYNELLEPIRFSFLLDRRSFVQIFGAGVFITAVGSPALAQRGNRRGGGPPPIISARIHLGDDGTITVLSGKVDCGQGARGQMAQATAEELRVPIEQVRVVLGDTKLVPNDGLTAGSGTTPRTIPAVRKAAAAVRDLLVEHAAKQWNVEPADVDAREGKVTHANSGRSLGYAEVAKDDALIERLSKQVPDDANTTPSTEWRVLGKSHPAPAARDKVTGAHQYPSDMRRPDMLYGRVLRSPAYRAKLASVDTSAAKAMNGVAVIEDGEFVGVCAPSAFRANEAIEAIAAVAKWNDEPIPSSEQLYDHLRENAVGGVPANPFADDVAKAAKSVKQSYHIAYVQHVPLEPRTALAEWIDGKLTVWHGTQNPFGVREELKRAFRLSDDDVQVIVPDFGSGYGGKHTGETAVEAARLAKGAGKPVMLRWTREEEFTWAYFRPAGVVEMEATLDDQNGLTSWHFVNINSGPHSIEIPYNIGAKNKSQHVRSKPPLREGSYRCLASTGNTFARESFMDELAAAAGADPLEFRLNYLDHERLRPVLEEAARQFKWAERAKDKRPNRGIGLACGTDKGSYVAACAEVEIDPQTKDIKVVHVCEAFECGAILNPDNLRNQVEGAIVMGLGPALAEETRFADGKMENATLRRYRVPHFDDMPTIDVHLLNRPDLPSSGAGETPIIAVAPAIGNAVFNATGKRLRSMPMKLA